MATDIPESELATDPSAEPQDSNLSKVTKLQKEVATRLDNSSDVVRERVVELLVEREVTDRVGLIDRGISKRAEAFREVKKLERPDQSSYDAEGKVTSTSFSKPAVENLKKAREALTKVETALDKAFAGDFSKLKEVCQKS